MTSAAAAYLAHTRACPGQIIGDSLARGTQIAIPAAMLACLMVGFVALFALGSGF